MDACFCGAKAHRCDFLASITSQNSSRAWAEDRIGRCGTEAFSCAQGLRHIAAIMMRRAGVCIGNKWQPVRVYGKAAGFFSEDAFAMADKHALKLIGIMFAALTLMVISTAAVVVAGHAASGANGEYVKLVDLDD
jgi:hypothetical protein